MKRSPRFLLSRPAFGKRVCLKRSQALPNGRAAGTPGATWRWLLPSGEGRNLRGPLTEGRITPSDTHPPPHTHLGLCFRDFAGHPRGARVGAEFIGDKPAGKRASPTAAQALCSPRPEFLPWEPPKKICRPLSEEEALQAGAIEVRARQEARSARRLRRCSLPAQCEGRGGAWGGGGEGGFLGGVAPVCRCLL